MPEAVLFDMDGVLVDSEDYWVARQRETLLPEAVEEEVSAREITGMNYREMYDYFEREYTPTLSRAGFLARFEAVATEIYTEHVSLLSGFEELAADLRDRGVAVGLVSSSPQSWIDLVLERFDVGAAFDAVVSAESLDAPGKPDGAVYEHAAGVVGVDPADCVAVEDSAHGIRAVRDAGMTCVAYRIDAHEGIDYTAADHVVDGPEELRTVLLALVGDR